MQKETGLVVQKRLKKVKAKQNEFKKKEIMKIKGQTKKANEKRGECET